jgi:hypothetical protein
MESLLACLDPRLFLLSHSQSAEEDPRSLMTWLDKVYVAFDSLVDAYGERVNKIEVVRDRRAGIS